MQGVTVVDHPLVQHKLTLMRDKERSTKGFRQLLNEIGMLLCYEVTRDLPIERIEIETPLTTMEGAQIAGKKLVFAPILRAGVGFLDGMLTLVPAARVAHIGLYRDPESLQAVEYYFKAPSDLADRMVLVLDPMLATANSAVAAIDRLKERGAKDLRFVCLLAAPEGIEKLRGAHPDVHDLDRRHRRAPQRSRLYRAGPRRCRRPHVRNALTRRLTRQRIGSSPCASSSPIGERPASAAICIENETILDQVSSDEGVSALQKRPASRRVPAPMRALARRPSPTRRCCSSAWSEAARAGSRRPMPPARPGPAEIAKAMMPVDLESGRKGYIVPGLFCEPAPGRRRRDARRGDARSRLRRRERARSARRARIPNGSRCKDGRIERFATYMTGEMYALLREHSMIGRPATEPEDPKGFDLGLDAAERNGGEPNASACCTSCSAPARRSSRGAWHSSLLGSLPVGPSHGRRDQRRARPVRPPRLRHHPRRAGPRRSLCPCPEAPRHRGGVQGSAAGADRRPRAHRAPACIGMTGTRHPGRAKRDPGSHVG